MQYRLHIPGYVEPRPEFQAVTSPYTGDVVGEVETVGAEGMSRAITVARDAFEAHPHGLPGHERAEILERTAAAIENRHEELALLIAREGGKPLVDARVEVTRAASTTRVAAEEATRIRGEEIPMQASAAATGRVAFTVREPIGVVAAVSAFNHPLNLIAHQVAPAVAAGCPVIVKPAAETALSCMAYMEMLTEAGLPQEMGMAVMADLEVSESLVTSDRIGFFSFIGSARVGWYLRSRLAPGVRCTLEHGGAAPVIVDESADLERVLPAVLKGGYYHAGQVCVSVQRAFVHHKLVESFLERLAAGAEKLVVGDPTLPETEVGPLIREKEVERVHDWVQDAVREGAECRTGGRPMEHQCYAPTVLANAPTNSRVMQEEIFGPVVAVSAFESLDQAVSKANNVPWAFQAAVFSQDVDRAMSTARLLKGAAVMINDHPAFRVDWMPFAGRGPSGLGVGGVKYSIEDLTEEKMIVMNLRSPE